MTNDKSIETGRGFIQEWLASLSPQERETIDANFRECLPKLKQIETVRNGMLEARYGAEARRFRSSTFKYRRNRRFECTADSVGIDPENLTAGEVVAIALEWVRQQEAGADRQQAIHGIRELRFKLSRQTAPIT